MYNIIKVAARKLMLINQMQRQAKQFVALMVRQMGPAINSTRDIRGVAPCDMLEAIAKQMCKAELEFENNYLIHKMQAYQVGWGFRGFEFIGMDNSEGAAILQFSSEDLQLALRSELGQVPVLKFRFNMVDDTIGVLAVTKCKILPIHLMDMVHIEEIQPIWEEWRKRSIKWIKEYAESSCEYSL